MAVVDTTPVLPLAGTLDGSEKVPVVGAAGIPVQTTTQDIANIALAVRPSNVTASELSPSNVGRWSVTVPDASPFVVDGSVSVLDCSGVSGNQDVTFPAAVGVPFRLLWVKCSPSFDVTITPTSGTINGAADYTAAAGAVVAVFVANGTDWTLILAL